MALMKLVVNPRLSIPLDEFTFTFARSSGPGGQNVNKVNTKALLRWPVAASPSLPAEVKERFVAANRRRITTAGELVLTSDRFRDQGRNVADCWEKLRAMLSAAAVRPTPRRATRPTRCAVQRRLEHKQHRGQKKQSRRPPAAEG
jgi:ribosome-associated protein